MSYPIPNSLWRFLSDVAVSSPSWFRGKACRYLVDFAVYFIEQILLDRCHGPHADAKQTQGDDNDSHPGDFCPQ